MDRNMLLLNKLTHSHKTSRKFRAEQYCPPFARGEKRPDAAVFPPLAKGGVGGVRAAAQAMHLKTALAMTARVTNRSQCLAGETKDVGSRPRTIGRRTNRGSDAPGNPAGGFRRKRRRGPGACPGLVPLFILERDLASRRWRRASRVPVP